jgi:hypothetical protein
LLRYLDEFRPVLVDDGVEGEAVAPRGREVSHVDIVVTGCFHLAPEQQGILGGPEVNGIKLLFILPLPM